MTINPVELSEAETKANTNQASHLEELPDHILDLVAGGGAPTCVSVPTSGDDGTTRTNNSK